MSEFFVYPEDLSDVEESTYTSKSTSSPSFNQENYSFNQELFTIVENEIKSKKTNKSVLNTNTNTNDSKRNTQVNCFLNNKHFKLSSLIS